MGPVDAARKAPKGAGYVVFRDCDGVGVAAADTPDIMRELAEPSA